MNPTQPTSGTSSSMALGQVSPNSSRTFTLSKTIVQKRKSGEYKPKVEETGGIKPAYLLNASATCIGDSIYVFGGFDAITDEVYNHVLKLDLNTAQWILVDNFGDIPGVRMGHTATLWKDNKILVYGGENEHREHLSDVIIFDAATAHWTAPSIKGQPPTGRARHAAVIYDDKLFITGGQLMGADGRSYTSDDMCYLDLKTWTWSKAWSFVFRYDHTAWVSDGKIYVFGGIAHDMTREGGLYCLDLKNSHVLRKVVGLEEAYPDQDSAYYQRLSTEDSSPMSPPYEVSGPHLALQQKANQFLQRRIDYNSRQEMRKRYPATITAIRFVSGDDVPDPAKGNHFYAFTSGTMLDFNTPASNIRPENVSLSALDINEQCWQTLVEGRHIFDPDYRWAYCIVSDDKAKAWLLGAKVTSPGEESFDFMSHILSMDLTQYAATGNDGPIFVTRGLDLEGYKTPAGVGPLAADLAVMFDQPPEAGKGADFTITAIKDSNSDSVGVAQVSPPIHVHWFVLFTRWAHFRRIWGHQMLEFHTRKMHIEEPYSTVRAFLYYLYTDSIARHSEYCASLEEVGGMLVMATVYDVPRLRERCLVRLARELSVEHAALIYEKASLANEEYLKERAAKFILLHWGRTVRTPGFRKLDPDLMVEICQYTDKDARVLGRHELEAIGGLGGAKITRQPPSNEQKARELLAITLGRSVDDLDDEDIDMDG